ncbi:MAG TPA: hypothetical protein VGB45_05455 [Abditibacterium sp.]|jgi:hypothetical protein
MKNFALSEVESLRVEVRQLRESVANLETRLADFESEEEQENPWGIWPYCYFVSTWDFGRKCFHCFHKNLNKSQLRRRNVRQRHRAAQSEPMSSALKLV